MDAEFKALLQQHTRALDANTQALTGEGKPKTSTSSSEGGAKAGGGGFGGAISGVMGALKVFTGGLAVATGSLFAISKFVEAINPGQAELFSTALRDLTATIGTSLVPVLGIATGVINELAGQILPLMGQLQPLFTQVANVLANNVIKQFRFLTQTIETLMPLFDAAAQLVEVVLMFGQVLSTMMQPAVIIISALLAAMAPSISLVMAAMKQVAEVMQLVTTVISILVKAITDSVGAMVKGFLGDGADFKDMIKQFGDAIKEVVVQVVLLAAAMARFMGMNDVVDRFRKGLDKATERPRGARAVNPTDASLGTIQSVTNQMTLNAANAVMGTGARTDPVEDWLKKIADGLDQNLDPDTLKDTIIAAIREAGEKVGGDAARGTAQAALDPLGIFSPSRRKWLADQGMSMARQLGLVQ